MTAMRQMLRSLARSPGYAVCAILIIAFSAAAAGTGGGILYRTLVAPRLIAEPVVMLEPYTADTGTAIPMSPSEYQSWVAQDGFFRDSASRSLRRQGVNLSGGPRFLHVHYVSANFFRVLRVAFAAGAAFDGNVNGVVVSHAFWVNSLDGAQDAVGGILEISERPYRITGVAARDFQLPGPQADIWVSAEREVVGRYGDLDVFARLPEAVTLTQARAQADAVFSRLDWTRAGGPGADALRVVRVGRRINEPIEGVLCVIGIGLLAALACSVLAFGTLLQLRRSRRRTDEWTRHALGAGLGYRVRQAAVECFPIVGLGAAGALLFWSWTAPAARNLVLVDAVGGGAGAEVVAGLVITVASAVVVAVTGAAIASLADRFAAGGPVGVGQSATRRMTGSSLPLRISSIVQVALAVVLVHAGATVYGSIGAMADIESLGIPDDPVLSIVVDLARNSGLERSDQIAEVLRLVRAARGIPGVGGAAASLGIPGEPRLRGLADLLHDHPITGDRVRMSLGLVPVTADYFAVTGIPILAGRAFDNRDGDGAEWATILSASAARMLYADQDPIDRMVYGLGARVVGVVGDVIYATDGDQPPVHYRPITQFPVPGMHLLVNGRGDSVPDAGAVVEMIRRTSPDLPVEESTIVGAPPPALAVDRRARAWAVGAAAFLIFFQTVLTLYGTAAYAAARRSREYALKMALGAARRAIALDVLRLSFVDTAAGLAVGTAVVLAFQRHLETLAGGVAGSASDVSIHGFALGGVALLAIVSAFQPAFRATRVEPATILADDAGA